VLVIDASDPRAVAWLRRAIVLLLVAGLLSFLARGANGPADPSLAPGPATPAAPTTTNLPGGG
jgi:hypothetical protein